jgi:hypothetical protein
VTIVYLRDDRRVGIRQLQPALWVLRAAQRDQIAVTVAVAIVAPHQIREERMTRHVGERGTPPLVQLPSLDESLDHALPQRLRFEPHYLPRSGLPCLPGSGGGGGGLPGGSWPSVVGSGFGVGRSRMPM